MAEIRLSDEQRAVVFSDDPRLVVVASAGAGKTRVLVERYLRHVVEEAIGPEAILTITFTKKAAAEMKGRIVGALRERGLFDAAQSAETGPIQTIHSFCERLLRENALSAGLDPAYEILDEGASRRLVASCVREALASDLEEEPFAERLVSHLAGTAPQGSERGRSPYARLEEEVSRVLSELRGTAIPPLMWRQRYADPEALAAFWEESILASLFPDTAAVLANVDAPSLQERLYQAHRATGEKAPWCSGKPDAAAEADALEKACGIVQLACAAWWRLEREMTARQTLDFTELEARAVRLLNKRPEVRERLAVQYRVAMIDESQDVNPQQDRLFTAMGVERTMVVGDAQQSIYGFRGADVALFRARTLEGSMPLSRNWRSEAGILRFVDHVFAPLWADYAPMAPPPAPFRLDEIATPDGFEGVEIWRQNAFDPNATAVYVRKMLEEGVRPGDTAILVRSAAAAGRLKTGLDGEGVPARIAGGSERFYTRLEVRDLSNALRAVADPYDDYALLCALRSPVAGLSLDAVVHLAADGGGVVDRLDPERLPNESDRRRLAEFLLWYTPLRGVADRLPAGEALAEIFAASPFLTNMARRADGPQAVANARKLLALALTEPSLGPGEYAERVWEIQEVRHKEGDAPADANEDVVTLMTIHKAKGLEFPVVVLPRHDAGLPGRLARRADRRAARDGDGEAGQGPAPRPSLRGGDARRPRRGGRAKDALRRAHPRPETPVRLRLPPELPPLDELDPRWADQGGRPARRDRPGRDAPAGRGLGGVRDFFVAA